VHSVVVAISVAAFILVAELPDKSMFVVLVLGTRFARWPVALGACAAFLVHTCIAVVGGGLVRLLPHRVSAAIVAVLFLAGAIWMLRESMQHDQPDEVEAAKEEREAEARVGTNRSALRIAGVTFGFVFLSEWGDITQVATVSMAARWGAWPVAVGAVIGLWSAVALALTVGGALLRKLPPVLFHRIAAAALFIFFLVSLVTVIKG
jgi:putative Ca2+/H+ antiporter (TMEM165/GDT1 family)